MRSLEYRPRFGLVHTERMSVRLQSYIYFSHSGMRPLSSFTRSLLRIRAPNRTAATLRKLAPTDQPLEEEALAGYDPNHFCHVAPGVVVADGRYSIIAKLGWGRSSTVWLAKDLERHVFD